MNKHWVLLLLITSLLAAACGDDDTAASNTPTGTPEPTTADVPEPDVPEPDVDPAALIFIWTESGGCMQAGPNCARYEVAADGTVSTFRDGEDEAVATGAVDADEVQAWLDAVAETDIDALIARLGPGEFTGAFDGVDYALEVPSADIALSSVDVEFAPQEPFFEAATSLAQAAADAAPLEIMFR